MKKFIVSCILLLCIALSGCSGGDKNKIPDDLIVVLPDGKEIYLYMPHDDAAEVLGTSSEIKMEKQLGSQYIYNDLKLSVRYTENLLTEIILQPGTACKSKSGLSPKSKKSDFINAGFNNSDAILKYYSKDSETFVQIKNKPESSSFQSTILLTSSYYYTTADTPNFKGFPIHIVDYHCISTHKFD